MSTNRHEPYEELISVSLTEELSPTERQQLDAHLDTCSQCRDTLAAFAGQRRIMAGLRHVGPPRDLGARVRTGIERGRFATIPWWRRPAVVFAGVGGSLAAVTGALLALVLMNGSPSGPEVGREPSPTPSSTIVAASDVPQQTLPPAPTPTPDASPAESAPQATPEPSATQNPVAEAPKPDLVMAATGPVQDLSLMVVEAATNDEVPVEAPVDSPDEPGSPIGPPIVAELSPDGQWLAFITEVGGAARTDVWATRLAGTPEPADPDASSPTDSAASVGETVHLGTSMAGSPFLERLAWSSDGAYLAYTIMDPDAGEEADEVNVDAWIFATAEAETHQLTETGTAYAASFVPDAEGGDSAPRLWISTADVEPVSRLHELSGDSGPINPERDAIAEAEGVFQPLLSPNGQLAIFWRGQMATDRDRGWIFAEDGAPQLAEHDIEDGTFAFGNERPVFSDLAARGMLFESAAITWSLDGDAYAIWNASWIGEPVDAPETYPDQSRVYFGHASDHRGLTRVHAIDRADVDPDLVVVDVEVAPTGGHLLITARQRPGGIMDTPRAELRLITRNVGDVADEVEVLEIAEDGWAGPAVFQAKPEWDSSLAP